MTQRREKEAELLLMNAVEPVFIANERKGCREIL